MADTLLQTKLYMAQPRPSFVPRPHLIRRLNQGLQLGCKLILISAPAGFGKTTLIAEWGMRMAESGNSPYSSIRHPQLCWLSLDEGDNDLARFLTYFVAALQTIDSNLGQGVSGALQSQEDMNVEVILTVILNELAEFSDNVVFVLDDYHVIESQPIDQALYFLLDHLPSQVHFVVASRIDPSWPLSRLRAGGQMTEIRTDDLRFTQDEAAAFLNQVMGFDLSTQDVVALDNRTEGWIAGLQLAALAMQGPVSLQGPDDVRKFVHSFAGSNRFILDYLGEEVLEQRPKGTRDFLLQTSILDHLSGPLCDAVTERQESQTVLEALEAANLFIVPLDNERCWYRYHHLFADLLAHRLKQTNHDQIPALHRRASVWYENEGYIDEAIHHAKAAGDAKRIADILEEHWQTITHRGEVTKLRAWLDALGPEITKKSAPLSMAYCWIDILKATHRQLPSHLEVVKDAMLRGMEPENDRMPMRLAVIPSLVETIEATITLDNKQPAQAKAHAQKAISLIPDASNPAVRQLLHGAASYRLALAHKALGEYEEACVVFLQGLEMLKASKNYFGVAATMWQVVTMYQALEKPGEAFRVCKDTLDYIEKHHWENMPPSGISYLVLAELQADSGDVAQAQKNLVHGRKLVGSMKTRHVLDLMKRLEEKLDGSTPPHQPLAEPLSPREIEVLELVAEGLSNREIGEKLYLALDTVKGHNRNIYGKLGVHRRTEAVACAREMGLL